jgi:hypothetical protein
MLGRIAGSARHLLQAEPAAQPFHGVAIIPKSGSCPKAHELSRERRRYLAGEAPPLPLAECTNPDTCSCHYAELTDRRMSERRSYALPDRCYAGQERRRTRGRRSSDR